MLLEFITVYLFHVEGVSYAAI